MHKTQLLNLITVARSLLENTDLETGMTTIGEKQFKLDTNKTYIEYATNSVGFLGYAYLIANKLQEPQKETYSSRTISHKLIHYLGMCDFEKDSFPQPKNVNLVALIAYDTIVKTTTDTDLNTIVQSKNKDVFSIATHINILLKVIHSLEVIRKSINERIYYINSSIQLVFKEIVKKEKYFDINFDINTEKELKNDLLKSLDNHYKKIQNMEDSSVYNKPMLLCKDCTYFIQNKCNFNNKLGGIKYNGYSTHIENPCVNANKFELNPKYK